MTRSSNSRRSGPTESRTPWAWSVGLVLFIGLAPLVAAFLGELIALAMGCEVAIPELGACSRGVAFFESLSMWLMAMIRWAIITVPAAVITLVGLAVTFAVLKKRGENA